MGLIIKQRLKFLNSLGFGFKDKPMLHCGEGNKIAGSIVIFNSIKMMYNPILGQRLFVRFLPYYYVFQHITSCSSTGVGWLANSNIPITSIKFSTFPVASIFSLAKGNVLPTMFRILMNGLATSNAMSRMLDFLNITLAKILSTVFGIRPFMFRHIVIIPQVAKTINVHEVVDI